MGNENKQRPFYVYKLLNELTDEKHELTTNEIVDFLWEKYNVRTQRTRIPQNIELLQKIGVDIQADEVSGRSSKYCILGRTFDTAELKLLIDAVHSSMFLTREKSSDLTKKILSLTSVHEAEAISYAFINGKQQQKWRQVLSLSPLPSVLYPRYFTLLPVPSSLPSPSVSAATSSPVL